MIDTSKIVFNHLFKDEKKELFLLNKKKKNNYFIFEEEERKSCQIKTLTINSFSIGIEITSEDQKTN